MEDKNCGNVTAHYLQVREFLRYNFSWSHTTPGMMLTVVVMKLIL
jgi:hypothetical protein